MKEWDWLQEQVIPPLLDPGATAHPRVWSIGSTADAVAVTVAFAHAAPPQSPGVQAFVSGVGEQAATVSFARAELGAVPAAERSRWFRREDQGWVPDRMIANQVWMGEPPGAVDLVTIRDPADYSDGSTTAAVAGQLRTGGYLLFVDPPNVRPRHLEPIDRAGRLFRQPAGSAPSDLGIQRDLRAQPDLRKGGTDGFDSLAQRQFQQQLVHTHLRLARALAHRFLHRGEAPDELEQVALLALVKAARRFDPGRNNTFATYATVSILGELKRHFRDKTWMLRVPRSTQELYLAIKEAREELGHQLGRVPTVADIANHLGVAEEAVLEAMEAGSSYWTTSLDVPGSDGERGIDIPVVDASLDRALDRERLRAVLPRLDEKERLVLRRLYFDGYTQQRVADEVGASQMQVSRLLARTLAKLRRWCSDDDTARRDQWLEQPA